MKNNLHQGVACESIVAAYLASKGYYVFLPQTNSRIDLIYEEENSRLIRVQVKAATIKKKGKYQYEEAKCYSSTEQRPYTSRDIDEFWVVGTSLWRFPVWFIENKYQLQLGSDNEKYTGDRVGYSCDEFILVKGSFENPYRRRLE